MNRSASSWFLGLAAALFLALGPALAPVLSTSPQGRTIEICTVFGLVKQAVSGDYAVPGKDRPEQGHHGNRGHCVLCHMRQFALLPQPVSVPAPSVRMFVPAGLAGTVAAAQPVSLSYHSRAPPRFS